jgi:hypothetical protein
LCTARARAPRPELRDRSFETELRDRSSETGAPRPELRDRSSETELRDGGPRPEVRDGGPRRRSETGAPRPCAAHAGKGLAAPPACDHHRHCAFVSVCVWIGTNFLCKGDFICNLISSLRQARIVRATRDHSSPGSRAFCRGIVPAGPGWPITGTREFTRELVVSCLYRYVLKVLYAAPARPPRHPLQEM